MRERIARLLLRISPNPSKALRHDLLLLSANAKQKRRVGVTAAKRHRGVELRSVTGSAPRMYYNDAPRMYYNDDSCKTAIDLKATAMYSC